MRFKIDRASLIVGSKFTVFAFFFFVFEESFSKYKPPGAYIWRSDLPEGFVRYRIGGLYLEGLIHGGAYFRNFTVSHYYLITIKKSLLSIQLFQERLSRTRQS